MYVPTSLFSGLGRQICKLHGGEIAKKLRGAARFKYLDDSPSASPQSRIKHEKELFAREILQSQRELISEFDTQIAGKMGDESEKDEAMKRKKFQHTKNSLRLYGLLRPHALPFYKEDSLVNLEKRLENVIDKADNDDKYSSMGNSTLVPMPLQNFLPEVNHDAFIVAIQAVAQSLADDLTELCEIFSFDDLPDRHDPLRLNKLIALLLDSFKLSSDPSGVDPWMKNCWPKLKNILPSSLTSFSDKEVSDWLKGHLMRVKENKKAYPSIAKEDDWYNFSRDFIFDTYPLPPSYLKMYRSPFPLQNASTYFKKFSSFFELSGQHDDTHTSELFQEFIYNLDKIGLSNWMKMDDIKEFEDQLPEGVMPKIDITSDLLNTSKFLTQLASRGITNLLEIPDIDPHTLLNEGLASHPKLALMRVPENENLRDDEIAEFFDEKALKMVFKNSPTATHTHKMKSFLSKFGKTPIELLYESEREFEAEASPIEWTSENSKPSWRWKPPENASYDPSRKIYVRNAEGIDPQLNLSELRTTVLDLNKMMNMTKDGRVFFFRAIVAVGNGRGLFGIGIGYGNNARSARLDASLDGVKKCEFIDFDKTGILNTPVHGREYSAHVKIIPRPRGKGIQCNRKFLPLAYIMGLENCKLKFSGSSTRWISRARALQRALDGIQSRQTISNATGQKLSPIIAPGDHWVHWPDRWFGPMYTQNHSRKGLHDKLKTTNRYTLKKLPIK